MSTVPDSTLDRWSRPARFYPAAAICVSYGTAAQTSSRDISRSAASTWNRDRSYATAELGEEAVRTFATLTVRCWSSSCTPTMTVALTIETDANPGLMLMA